ncbi:MAG: hypothetical protein Phyf2KO_01460 [Phycisphaerales bacterium]
MALTKRTTFPLIMLAGAVLIAFVILVPSCDNAAGGAPEGLVRVDIPDNEGKQHTFFLEPAINNDSRFKGLSGRTTIDDDGGMIFVFPNAAVRKFVMRDCPIPIDIVYIDTGGRVIAAHAMLPEDPQAEGESDSAYEERLKRYSSRFATPLVIELQGGMIEKLGIDESDVLKVYGLDDLEKRAK